VPSLPREIQLSAAVTVRTAVMRAVTGPVAGLLRLAYALPLPQVPGMGDIDPSSLPTADADAKPSTVVLAAERVRNALMALTN
jgi:hypothetical protein